MNKIYYSQVDNRWKDYPYPSQELPKATIGSGGCGATSAAMIVSMLKQIILPPDMGDVFIKDGIRVNGGTSNKAFDSYLTDRYGLVMNKKWKLDEAIECLKRGGLVVTRCLASRGTLFTSGGHFIVIVGWDESNRTLEVFDPYLYSTKFTTEFRKGKATISGTSVFVTYDNMKEYGGYYELWCYEPTGVDTNKDENIQPKKEVYNRGTVGSSKKLKQNCSLWSNSDLSGTMYSYLKNTTVKVIENTGLNIDKIYVPATGRTAYIDINNYTDQPANNGYKLMTVTARSGLNVRSGPGTKNKIVTAYKLGTVVKVYSIENGWARGTKGYMCADYLK